MDREEYRLAGRPQGLRDSIPKCVKASVGGARKGVKFDEGRWGGGEKDREIKTKKKKLTTLVIYARAFTPWSSFPHQAQLVQFLHHALHVPLVGEIVRVHAYQARSLLRAARPTAWAVLVIVVVIVVVVLLLLLGGGLGGDLGAAAELAGCRGVGHDAPDGVHVAGRGEQHPFAARDPARLRRGQDAVRRGFAHGRQVPGEKGAGAPREGGLLVRYGRAAFVQQARAVFHQAREILLQRSW